MALTPEQELSGHESRIDQMTVNIKTMRNDMRYENRKFLLQAVTLVVGAFAAGAAWMRYLS